MEKTITPFEPVHGGIVCLSCAHLDFQPQRQSLCRRYPPGMVGGVVMAQTMGSPDPQPAIFKNNYWPNIGMPESHWCGEHKPKRTTALDAVPDTNAA